MLDLVEAFLLMLMQLLQQLDVAPVALLQITNAQETLSLAAVVGPKQLKQQQQQQ